MLDLLDIWFLVRPFQTQEDQMICRQISTSFHKEIGLVSVNLYPYAIEIGSLSLLEWSRVIPRGHSTCKIAAMHGHLEILQ